MSIEYSLVEEGAQAPLGSKEITDLGMTAAFCTDGETIIKEVVNVNATFLPTKTAADFQQFYELNRCSRWISDNHLQKVALQFPDSLLKDSASLVHKLKSSTNADVVVLADTSYGSCCVDEVAAQHYQCDALIHYGSSCLSPTNRIPVLYVFGEQPVDLDHCCHEVSLLVPDSGKIIVLYDVIYQHIVGKLELKLKSLCEELLISNLNITSSDAPSSEDSDDHSLLSKCARTLVVPKGRDISDYSILFIGSPDTLCFTNCVYNFTRCPFYTYNPATKVARKESLNVNKMLMKRYYMVEKAKDARLVGILVGTLGVSNYLECIKRLKAMITNAGKKSYTFVVGKLNVAKLANFAEIEVFVLVACAENSLLDSTEFYQPVVTPYEMELACNPSREWSEEYVTDFRQLLPEGAFHQELPSEPLALTTDVSLITGGLRRLGVDSDDEGPAGGAVMKRDDILTVANTAGEYLSNRSWRGLEQELGKTAVTTAVEGTTGIAMGYAHEPKP